MESLILVNRLISQPDGLSRNRDALKMHLESFCDACADPSSPASVEMLEAAAGDDLKPLLGTLGGGAGGVAAEVPIEIEILVARALRILLRKEVNREGLGKFGIKCIVRMVLKQTQKQTAAAAEVGNVVLNACYNGANVASYVEEGGVPPLLRLLRSRDLAVQASVLGALQSVCYVSYGRHSIAHDQATIMQLARYLLSDHDVVRSRAIGVIHNISADIPAISALRESMCIAPVISLLSDASPEVVESAVGTLQNMSREEVSRLLILDQGALDKLVKILLGNHIQTQISSVGALLNLLGPALETEGDRAALMRTLADGVVLGAANSCIFNEDAEAV